MSQYNINLVFWDAWLDSQVKKINQSFTVQDKEWHTLMKYAMNSYCEICDLLGVN